MKRGLVTVAALASLLLAAPAHAAGREVEVVAVLEGPSLARAVESSRVLSAAVKARRLSLSAPSSRSHLRTLTARQRDVEAAIAEAIPEARVRWRYRIVLNALAVAVPADRVARLADVPGVASVHAGVRYQASLDRTPGRIAAPALWNSATPTRGDGVKIAILDDGIEHTHPFFSPAGFAMPEGFPKGNAAYTSAKVVAARAFPPLAPRWRHAAKPFDPEQSEHGTHVAGIAAGNAGVVPAGFGGAVSGVAPRAYLGNYKVLTIPTDSGVGLDGNSPEIAAGIEAAVADGMDVINLSLGEPEIEPTRDLVAQAVDAASDAGVVVTIAAGNDGAGFGAGSVSSPASAEKAISVAATGSGERPAAFTSVGPTPLSLRLKPELAAPGVAVLSSVPVANGSWAAFSGTSMAAPHVAGAAALLLQRHPDWTPERVKSALVQTARPLDAPPTVVGAGLVDVSRADTPLLSASPTTVSFGHVRAGTAATREVALADAGGGAGEWAVRVDGTGVTAPATVTVPGTLLLAAPAGQAGLHAGAVVLTRGADSRRIPYWLRVTAPRLARHRTTPLRRTGTYRGSTAGRPALVASYLYPARSGGGEAERLAGPEQVFRVRLARPAANFGVAVIARGRRVEVQPRITLAGDETRSVGYTSLPLNLNPYLPSFMEPRLVAGAVLPAAGAYDVVFDSPSRARAGRFAFRFWVNDVTPPRLRVHARRVVRGRPLRVTAADAGSGVDPESIVAEVDGRPARYAYRRGVISVATAGLARGRHRLLLQVSDYQETRNMENVARILPNTRRVSVAFVVR